MHTKWPCVENGVPCPLREPGCQDKCIKMLIAQLELHSDDSIKKKNKAAAVDVASGRIASSISRSRRKKRQI